MDRNDFTSEEAYQWYLKFSKAHNCYSREPVEHVGLPTPTLITMMATHIATVVAFVLASMLMLSVIGLIYLR